MLNPSAGKARLAQLAASPGNPDSRRNRIGNGPVFRPAQADSPVQENSRQLPLANRILRRPAFRSGTDLPAPCRFGHSPEWLQPARHGESRD
jgi:hypothetical protein